MRRVLAGVWLAVAFAGGALAQSGQYPPGTVAGNAGASAGPLAPVGKSQLTTLCNAFTATLGGCVPAAGATTTNFLHADGSWSTSVHTAPTGTSNNQAASTAFVQANNVGIVPAGADPTGVLDSTSAINTALAAANGRCVYLPAGTYATSAQLTLGNDGCLIGDGELIPGTTGTAHTVININSTTADAVHVNPFSSNVRIANLTIDRTGTPTSGTGLFIDHDGLSIISHVTTQNQFNGFALGPTSFSTCEYCYAQQNFNHGFLFFNTSALAVMQWTMNFTLAQNNNGWGYFFNAVTGAGNITFATWTNVATFANSSGGMSITGQSTANINDLNMIGLGLSSDGGDELALTPGGGTALKIVDPFIEQAGLFATGRGGATAASNVGRGIAIYGPSATLASVQIIGGYAYDNSQEGFYEEPNIKALSLDAFHSLSNSVKVSGVGIYINNTSTVTNVTGSFSYNINFSSQTYGIKAASGGNVTMSANNFNGNTTGSCLSSSGTFTAALNKDQDGSCAGNVGTFPGGGAQFSTVDSSNNIVQQWHNGIGGAASPTKFWRIITSTGQLQLLNSGFSTQLMDIDDAGGMHVANFVRPVAVAIASLPSCTASNVGARATVNNGLATPGYQGGVVAGGTGPATQPVACITTNGSTFTWVYD